MMTRSETLSLFPYLARSRSMALSPRVGSFDYLGTLMVDGSLGVVDAVTFGGSLCTTGAL